MRFEEFVHAMRSAWGIHSGEEPADVLARARRIARHYGIYNAAVKRQAGHAALPPREPARPPREPVWAPLWDGDSHPPTAAGAGAGTGAGAASPARSRFVRGFVTPRRAPSAAPTPRGAGGSAGPVPSRPGTAGFLAPSTNLSLAGLPRVARPPSGGVFGGGGTAFGPDHKDGGTSIGTTARFFGDSGRLARGAAGRGDFVRGNGPAATRVVRRPATAAGAGADVLGAIARGSAKPALLTLDLARGGGRGGTPGRGGAGLGGTLAVGDILARARPPPPPPPSSSRTKWTRLVHPSVLIGHVSSL